MTNESANPKKAPVWQHPLWLVIALGAALRFHQLGLYSLWYDESISIFGARFVDWKFTFLTSSESRLIPLFAVMGKIWYAFGEHVLGLSIGTRLGDTYLRLLPFAFSLALVPMTYALADYMFKRRDVALIAALGIALSPLQVYYAQEYRPHSAYAFFVCAGVYCSLRALDEGTRRWWIGTVITGILSIYAYYFAAFYLVCMNLYALTGFTRYRKRIKPWTISQLCILVAIIPPALMATTIWSNHTNAEEHWFPHPTLKTVLYTLKNFFAGYSPNVPLYWGLFFLGFGLLALGLFSIRRERLKISLLLCASFVPIILQILMWYTQEFAFFTYRIQLAFAPPIYILIALGVGALPKVWLRGCTAGLFALLSFWALGDYYAQRLHPVWDHVIGARYKIDNRAAANWVAEGLLDGDAVAHFCTLTLGPFKEHYLPDVDQSVISLSDKHMQELLLTYPDKKMWKTIGFMPRSGEAIVADAKRIWYVESWWEYGQTTTRMSEYRAWLEEQGTLIDQRSFDGARVLLYQINTAVKERP